MSSKMGGVKAIANALNEGDVARAQIATVLLGIPDLPVLSKAVDDPGQLIKCAPRSPKQRFAQSRLGF